MDVMQLRRGLMMGIASGANVIKGQYTVPMTGNACTINFGKTVEKYVYVVEMTEQSKADLSATGTNAWKMYGCIGMYPMLGIGGSAPGNNYLSMRLNPFESTVSTASSSSTTGAADNSSVSFTAASADSTSGVNTMYRGYTYNYMIIPIE